MFKSSMPAIRKAVASEGYAFASDHVVRKAVDANEHLSAFYQYWSDLPPDNYLKGSYIFRHRRYSQIGFVPSTLDFEILPESSYEQSPEINLYAGGIKRLFAPLARGFVDNPAFRGLVSSSFNVFDVPKEYLLHRWTVEVHMFRLSASGSDETHPTPEGIHRDGIPMGAVHMIRRQGVEGAVSHVYSLDRQLLGVSTLREPLDSLYAWDNRVMHYATPLVASNEVEGHRDILVYGFHLEGTEYEGG